MALIYDPTEDKLAYSFNILQALRDPAREDHYAAVTALKETVRADNREFALLMLHIFVQGGRYDNLPPDLRQLAGVIVKNECIGLFNIGTGQTRQQNLDQEVSKTLLDTLQMSLLEGISDENPDIRRTAAVLFGRVAECYEGDYWVPLIPKIVGTISASLGLINTENKDTKHLSGNAKSSQALVEAQLYTLRMVCEDASEKLAMHPSRPLDVLVPMFLGILTLSNANGEYDGTQLNALLSMNALLFLGASNKVRRLSGTGHESSQQQYRGSHKQSGGSAIILHMNAFCNSLGTLAYARSSSIRRGVCQSLCQLMTEQPATFGGGLSTVCEYMAKAVSDVDEGVAIEACEFWFALIHHSEAHIEVRKNIVQLVEGAVSRCVLTQEEIHNEREDEEMQATGEKKIHFLASGDGGTRFAEDSSTNYTIRRSAALLLDNVSQIFPDETANISLKSIEVLLQTKGEMEDQALKRECGMLVLGAIASGCQAALAASLPVIFPYFLEGMGDAFPEVRAISCWVQSRYCSWLISTVREGEDGDGNGIFKSMLHRLNLSLLDSSPKVQSSCCAAISTVLEATDPKLTLPYIESILEQLRQAYDSGLYGFKNRLLLMDLIGHIAEMFGPRQSRNLVTSLLTTFVPIVMPYFLHSDPDEAALACSMECLQAFCAGYGTAMRPYAPEIFSRALMILKTTLDAHDCVKAEALAEGIEFDLPPVDNVRASLELLSSLFGGLGAEVVAVLPIVHPRGEERTFEKTAVGNSLINLLSRSFSYQHDQLRSAALMVTGDLLKCAPLFLLPHFTETVLHTVYLTFHECEEVHDENTDLLVNACWCLGLISVACGSLPHTHGQQQLKLAEEEKTKLLKHLPRLLTSLGDFMAKAQEEDHPHTLRTNLASAFGRLALLCPEEVSLYLPGVLEDLLYSVALYALEHECPSSEQFDPERVVNFDAPGEEYMHTWKGLLEALNRNPDALMESPKAIRAFVHACAEGSRMAMICEERNCAPCRLTADREVKETVATILEAIRVHKPADMEASVDGEYQNLLSCYVRSLS